VERGKMRKEEWCGTKKLRKEKGYIRRKDVEGGGENKQYGKRKGIEG
jgi:hypothetical protein